MGRKRSFNAPSSCSTSGTAEPPDVCQTRSRSADNRLFTVHDGGRIRRNVQTLFLDMYYLVEIAIAEVLLYLADYRTHWYQLRTIFSPKLKVVSCFRKWRIVTPLVKEGGRPF